MMDLGAGWRAAGACLSADPDLFFPIASGPAAMKQITKAQQICARCPVRQECLEWAMRTPETHGIWGGTTPEERMRVRRARTAQRRVAARAAQAHEWPLASQIRAS